MFVYQGNDHDCGFAALKNLLADVHRDNNYLYLQNEKKNESYNLKEIVDIAEKYNVTLVGKEIDIDYLDEYLAKKKKFLATVEDELHRPHLVYVYKVIKNKLFIKDPAKGDIIVDIVNFRTSFLKTVLEFQSENFHRSKCPIKKKEIMSVKDQALLYTLSILSIISVFVSLSFIAYDFKFVYVAIALVAYVAFEALFRLYLHKFMKKFDEKYFNMLIDKPKEQVQYEYQILQQRKRYLFLTPITLITNFLFYVALLIIFAINGKVYILSVAILCLVTLVVESLHYFLTKNKREHLEYEEKKFLNGHPIDMNVFIDNTYSLAGTYSIKNLINLVISLFGSIYLMLVTNNQAVNFVLFYFVAIYVTLNKLTEMIQYIFNRDDDMRNEAMFRDTFLWK